MTVRLRTTTQAAWLKNRPTERKTKKDTMDNAKTKKIMNKGLNERRERKKNKQIERKNYEQMIGERNGQRKGEKNK